MVTQKMMWYRTTSKSHCGSKWKLLD